MIAHCTRDLAWENSRASVPHSAHNANFAAVNRRARIARSFNRASWSAVDSIIHSRTTERAGSVVVFATDSSDGADKSTARAASSSSCAFGASSRPAYASAMLALIQYSRPRLAKVWNSIAPRTIASAGRADPKQKKQACLPQRCSARPEVPNRTVSGACVTKRRSAALSSRRPLKKHCASSRAITCWAISSQH